jgi:hypothetical protein
MQQARTDQPHVKCGLRPLRQALEEKYTATDGLRSVGDDAIRGYVNFCLAEVDRYVAACAACSHPIERQRIDCTGLRLREIVIQLDPALEPIFRYVTIDLEGSAVGSRFEIIGWSDTGQATSCQALHCVNLTKTKIGMVSVARAHLLTVSCRDSVISILAVHWSAIEMLDLRSCSIDKYTEFDRADVSYIEAMRAAIPGGISILDSRVYFMSLRSARIDERLTCMRTGFDMVPDLTGTTLPVDLSLPPSQISLARSVDVLAHIERRVSEKVEVVPDRAPLSARYRLLRLAMKARGAHDLEALYFAREMRAERADRNNHYGTVDRFLSWLYDSVSEYGTSVHRALGWFLAWNTGFMLFFVLLQVLGPISVVFGYVVGLPEGAIRAENPAYVGVEAIGLSLQNAFNPLAMLSSNPAIKVNNPGLAFLSQVQTLGSIGIAALALLALRSRFQRGSGGGAS